MPGSKTFKEYVQKRYDNEIFNSIASYLIHNRHKLPMKDYLRVDDDHEDELIFNIIREAEDLVMDVGRLSGGEFLENKRKTRVAVLYAAAYLYEHREEADHKELTLTLRALLMGVREVML